MTLDLTGKIAIVTGGTSGIGAATVEALRTAGAIVYVFDRHGDPAVDVTDAASLGAAFTRTPPPDIVVVNAGIAPGADLLNTSEEDWNRTIAVNLTGAFRTVKLAAARMKARGHGAIVLTASTNSYDGEANLTAYNASKAGILGILHTAAGELGPYGIRVNAVCPGLIRTPLTESLYADTAAAKAYFREIPLGRGGEPREVANAIVFLASDNATFITGATLLVDGGQMATKFGPWNDEKGEFLTDHWVLR